MSTVPKSGSVRGDDHKLCLRHLLVQQSSANQSWALDDTEAHVIMPEALRNTRKPISYVLVLDCSEKRFNVGETPIINIAASKTLELFQALRLFQKMKSRSFTGAIRKLFSVYTPTLTLVVVCCYSVLPLEVDFNLLMLLLDEMRRKRRGDVYRRWL